MEAIDNFIASRMADRILGMGDCYNLLCWKSPRAVWWKKEAKKNSKENCKNKFGFDDFLANSTD